MSANDEQLHLDLQAYFDDELPVAERAKLESRLAAEPELAGELADLGIMREVVVAGLDAQAGDVPEARFEQIWDEIDASLDRETRLQESAASRPGMWGRLSAWMRPVGLPLGLAGAAAAVLVLVMDGSGDPSNTEAPVASKDAVQAPIPTPDKSDAAPKAAPADAMVAQAPDADSVEDGMEFEAPDSNEADVESIEFGGHSGHIERLEGARGTTTVIWVEEDDDVVDSERSL